MKELAQNARHALWELKNVIDLDYQKRRRELQSVENVPTDIRERRDWDKVWSGWWDKFVNDKEEHERFFASIDEVIQSWIDKCNKEEEERTALEEKQKDLQEKIDQLQEQMDRLST